MEEPLIGGEKVERTLLQDYLLYRIHVIRLVIRIISDLNFGEKLKGGLISNVVDSKEVHFLVGSI